MPQILNQNDEWDAFLYLQMFVSLGQTCRFGDQFICGHCHCQTDEKIGRRDSRIHGWDRSDQSSAGRYAMDDSDRTGQGFGKGLQCEGEGNEEAKAVHTWLGGCAIEKGKGGGEESQEKLNNFQKTHPQHTQIYKPPFPTI